ncbi:Crp/Fnr family transcriptional regulator [Occallatibacter savannae]|uniref:Crp/Fnr family transcriptional regulator n=1 Tax=Occallatibacter savannae TaxID=1002691 RepID=UPI0013A54665|nr:Crp/Fnr family transcriptional regulator [Occallatibacter savannae]
MLDDSTIKQDILEVSQPSPLSGILASPELIKEFIQRGRTLTFPRTAVLFRQGESATRVYLVISGAVALTLPFSTSHAIGFIAENGSIVGVPAAFGNQPYSMTGVVVARSELIAIEAEEFCKMIASDPVLSLNVLKILAAETRAARMAIAEAATAF